MRFGEPIYFNLFWLVALLTVFMVWALRKRRQLTERFCGPSLVSKLVGPGVYSRKTTRAVLLVISVLFLVFATTQPRWGFEWQELRQEGVDIIVALDVSSSMLAEDIKPNRLDRAKRKISDLIQMLEGDRIGLVAFAGTAFLQCPLTLDYAAAKLFLAAMDTGMISSQGTAIGAAIRTSLKAFQTQGKKSKAILLITDGEDQTGKALGAAKMAARGGVRIYALGIGGKIGAPIPNIGTEGGFKKDANGEVVLTKLDESTLEKIALTTGGAYVRSITGDLDLKTIYLDNIKPKIEKKELKTVRRKLWHERFQWMIFLGLMCLVIESLIDERKTPKGSFR
ncbi:MAG: VWA domain-containing protein [Nitrospinaceae bacterium]